MKQFRLISVLLIAVLAVSIASAQMTPRGGTVVTSDGEQLVGKNFNPYSPDPLNFSQRYIYEPMLLFNPVDGGLPTFWLATAMNTATTCKA